MKRLRWLLPLLVLCFAPLAHAQDGAEDEPGVFETLDAAFGKYLVGPMAKVLFFDIFFWDDSLAPGEGVGTVVDGDPPEEITGHGDAGYAYQARYTLSPAEVQVVLDAPVEVREGEVTVSVSSADRGLVGAVVAAELPLAPCAAVETCGEPLEQAADDLVTLGGARNVVLAAPPADPARVRVLRDRAPFPVAVVPTEAGTLRILGATVDPAPGMIAPSEGQKVRILRDGVGSGVVLEGATAESVIVRADTVRTDPTPLANPDQRAMPLVVAWLIFGALFFTVRMAFINLRGFGHAVVVTSGRYDHPDATGEISHFQALSSALSATVGLGNIAGVAIAVGVGGPGAIFWMIVAGFLGMSSKFTECTLGQMYREVDDKGRVLGGPMRYLDVGLAELGLPTLGKVLAVVFALMCIGGSLGGGNMFQANQSFAAVADVVPLFQGNGALFGLMLAVAVGVVILGGIKRIGAAAGIIVPVMCGVYVLAGLYILFVHAAEVPAALAHIVSEAFTPEAGYGGLIGVLVQGFRRAAFSNEAGVGSASIAHSAATTKEPVREGIVALLEPFIDTICVCTMTGLVVVVTGTYKTHSGDGVLMTSAAFESVLPWFPLVLSFAVVMFAFSTMISWSYYGERCATWLFGPAASTPYKIVFLMAVVFGAAIKLGNVLDFSDLMILGMAFPNIFGLLLLSGKVRAALDDYWARLRSGEMQVYSK